MKLLHETDTLMSNNAINKDVDCSDSSWINLGVVAKLTCILVILLEHTQYFHYFYICVLINLILDFALALHFDV
jgi:hypothetical protein